METKPQLKCLIGAGFWASVWIVGTIVSLVIGLSIWNFNQYNDKLNIFPITMVVSFLMILWVLLYLIYRFFYLQRIKYIISDKGINKKAGIINLYDKNIPWYKVTNTILIRGITSRILGLTDIGIHTAGSGSETPETTLFALDKDEAEKINELLTNRLEKLRDKYSE